MADIILFLIYVELMIQVAEILFWTSFFIILYTYAGYPILLFLLAKIKRSAWPLKVYPYPKENAWPEVTLVIAAFNEDNIIEEKIKNTLTLDYPPQKITILFITDGSTDNTPSIVNAYPSLLLLHQPGRQGKLAAMNRAMKHVKTPLVIFSDANTVLNADSIKKMVVHYADNHVGGVAGEKRIQLDEDAVTRGEGLYWKYESALKKLDSDLYTTVGAAGELFSMRSSLYTPLPEHVVIEDFVQSMLVCTKGYVIRYEPGAYAVERASVSVKDEMERKIRIAAGAFQAMGILKKLLNVFRFPVVSFQLISHRLLRWTLCPLSLVILLVSSFYLSFGKETFFYDLALLIQVLFYMTAAVGWVQARQNKQSKIFYLPFYFTFMHLCVFAGFSRFILKKQQAIWTKAERRKKI